MQHQGWKMLIFHILVLYFGLFWFWACVCVCGFLAFVLFFSFLASFIALLGNHLSLLDLKLMSYFPLVISDGCRLTIFSKQLFIGFHLYVSIPHFPSPAPKFTDLLHVQEFSGQKQKKIQCQQISRVYQLVECANW